MLICIPGCGICIPLESLLPFILMLVWNPLAKLLGFKTDDGYKVKKDDDATAKDSCCVSGTADGGDGGGDGEVVHLGTKDDFDATLAQAKADGSLVVVKFTAVWCGPCKEIAPKVKSLAQQERSGVFASVDVDDNDETASECNISAMPTFQFFRNGVRVNEMRGNNYGKLKRLIETYKSA